MSSYQSSSAKLQSLELDIRNLSMEFIAYASEIRQLLKEIEWNSKLKSGNRIDHQMDSKGQTSQLDLTDEVLSHGPRIVRVAPVNLQPIDRDNFGMFADECHEYAEHEEPIATSGCSDNEANDEICQESPMSGYPDGVGSVPDDAYIDEEGLLTYDELNRRIPMWRTYQPKEHPFIRDDHSCFALWKLWKLGSATTPSYEWLSTTFPRVSTWICSSDWRWIKKRLCIVEEMEYFVEMGIKFDEIVAEAERCLANNESKMLKLVQQIERARKRNEHVFFAEDMNSGRLSFHTGHYI